MSFFVYARVGSALLASVDQSLRSQAVDVSHLERGPARPSIGRAGGGVAQVIRTDGRRRDGSDPPGLPPLARARPRCGGSSAASGSCARAPCRRPRSDWRVLAEPTTVRGRRAARGGRESLEPRDETLDHLLRRAAARRAARARCSRRSPATAWRLRRSGRSRRCASGPRRSRPPPRARGCRSRPSRDEISRLAETLNEMLARLEAAFAHERRFVADASHELRTPLALLKTELEVALRRPRSHDELEQALRSASEETDRLTRLAEDLLLIARSDAGGSADSPGAGRRGRGARRRRQAVRRRGERSEAGPSRSSRTNGLDARCRPGATRAGAREPRRQRARPRRADGSSSPPSRDGELVELHVEDDGPGFPPKLHPRCLRSLHPLGRGA